MFYKSKPFIVILGIVLIGLLGYLGLNLGLEKSSESSQLIITSQSNNDTIKVTGWAWSENKILAGLVLIVLI